MGKIEFPIDQLHRISNEWKCFFDNNLDKPMIFFGSVYKHTDDPAIKNRMPFFNYPPETSAEEIIEIEDAFLRCRAFPGDTYPCITLNFGPCSLSIYMGARMEVNDSAWFFPTAKRLNDIPEQIDTGCYWYRRAHDILSVAAQKWPSSQVQVETSDMGNNLDILAALRGTEQLLLDLVDEPDTVKRKLATLTDAWKQSYRAEYDIISAMSIYTAGALGVLSGGKTVRLQSDFAYMISSEMYEEFVLPDIKAIADFLDDPCYHLDGIPQLKHLPILLQIDKIKAVEFVPGAGNKPPKEWTDVYRKIMSAGKQCLAFVSVKEALELKEAMGGNLRGFGLYIGEYLPFDEAEYIYRKLVL